MIPRREFIKHTAIAVATPLAVNTSLFAQAIVNKDKPLFKISLAQWSLHRMLRSNKLDALDFASFTKKTFDINAIEYVNSFFKEHAEDEDYLKQLKSRAEEHGVKSLLIMVDGEGALGDPDDAKRKQAIENHYQWVTAAKFLGCHSIRVNAQSSGGYEDQIKLAADGLSRLTEFAAKHDLNVIVENHGGLSSNGKWLAAVMKKVDHPRCGTLPDFGNFCLDWDRRDAPDAWYDRYQGVKELMPFAKAVSAKSHDFDEAGNETHTDFRRMMKIVLDADYHSYVGIEYEGEKLSEVQGIKATKKLLEKVREELTAKVGSSS
ncbi:MAG: sugar phosphate isomerase/epimerase [Planctomycetes bacterium]|nr:sugar phosphate isomerase/epimerase [Planctomycetota bacterium]